jgi:hypothetical protein
MLGNVGVGIVDNLIWRKTRACRNIYFGIFGPVVYGVIVVSQVLHIVDVKY